MLEECRYPEIIDGGGCRYLVIVFCIMAAAWQSEARRSGSSEAGTGEQWPCLVGGLQQVSSVKQEPESSDYGALQLAAGEADDSGWVSALWLRRSPAIGVPESLCGCGVASRRRIPRTRPGNPDCILVLRAGLSTAECSA